MRKNIALLAGLLVLVLANVTIYSREHLIADGRMVLLELAPVDPRSLMQGDYMALRFAIAREVSNRSDARMPQDGYIVLTLDERSIGTFVRIDDGSALKDTETRLRFRTRNGQVKFATNAFFFQEGDAEKYEIARYGEFRVSPDGDALLTHMRDKDGQRIGDGQHETP